MTVWLHRVVCDGLVRRRKGFSSLAQGQGTGTARQQDDDDAERIENIHWVAVIIKRMVFIPRDNQAAKSFPAIHWTRSFKD
jgi:hypothetical protein